MSDVTPLHTGDTPEQTPSRPFGEVKSQDLSAASQSPLAPHTEESQDLSAASQPPLASHIEESQDLSAASQPPLASHTEESQDLLSAASQPPLASHTEESQDLSAASQPPLAPNTEESIKSQPATSVLTNEECSDLPVERHVLYPAEHCTLNGTTPPAIFEDISLDGMTSGKESPRKTQILQEPPAAIFEDISMDGLGHENHNEGTQISFSTVLGLNLAESKSSLAPELSFNETQAVAQIQPSSRRRKRKRKRDDIMEHSGLESSLVKRVAIQTEAKSCLKPSGIDMDSTPEMVARELVKCMHEPKYELLKDVVRVLGVERTMELFEETSKIQESGGQLTADGNLKKTPGGVFLTLIKNSVTAEQKKEIFKRDKEIRLHREKEEKRRKKAREHSERVKMEQRLLREGADRQLYVFRAQLSPSNLPAVIPGDRRERNMHKRVSAPESLKKGGVFDRLGHKPAGGGEVQAMEVDTVSPKDSRRRKDTSSVKEENELAEHRLAEEFEQMNDCDLDFGIELS